MFKECNTLCPIQWKFDFQCAKLYFIFFKEKRSFLTHASIQLLPKTFVLKGNATSILKITVANEKTNAKVLKIRNIQIVQLYCSIATNDPYESGGTGVSSIKWSYYSWKSNGGCNHAPNEALAMSAVPTSVVFVDPHIFVPSFLENPSS